MKVALILTLLLSALLSNVQAGRRVVRFEIIDRSTPVHFTYSLLDNGVFVNPGPHIAIKAITAGSGQVRHLTFTKPCFHREYHAPYIFPGDDRNGNIFPLNLTDGYYQISAFANFNKNDTYFISLRVSTSKEDAAVHGPLPSRGPLPSEVVPDLASMDQLAVAPRKKGCNERPKIVINYADLSSYDPDLFFIDYTVAYCSGSDQNLRFRLLSYTSQLAPDGNNIVKTTVLQQAEENSFQSHSSVASQGKLQQLFCHPTYIYLEYCVMETAAEKKGTLSCDTSELIRMPPGLVPEPRMKYRPPIIVQLAPGDRIKLQTAIVHNPQKGGTTSKSGFSNGGFDVLPRNFSLYGVLEDSAGKQVRTKQRNGYSVITNIPMHPGGVDERDNNSRAFVKYSLQDCPSGEGSTLGRYSTKIVVSSQNKRLIRQDNKLPTFQTPKYPRVPFGERVEIKVEAQNPGGGMREGGVKTELHYQWYVRTRDFLFSPKTYAEAIHGATSATLVINKAVCSSSAGCGRNGCFNLHEYFVDVCNTYGCRRGHTSMADVGPPLFIPSGKEWNEFSCTLQDAM